MERGDKSGDELNEVLKTAAEVCSMLGDLNGDVEFLRLKSNPQDKSVDKFRKNALEIFESNMGLANIIQISNTVSAAVGSRVSAESVFAIQKNGMIAIIVTLSNAKTKKTPAIEKLYYEACCEMARHTDKLGEPLQQPQPQPLQHIAPDALNRLQQSVAIKLKEVATEYEKGITRLDGWD